MFKITIKTSTRLPAAQVAEVTNRLSQVFGQTGPTGGICEIVYDPDAPALETYGHVGRALVPPSMMICDLYAGCLGSLAKGFAASDVAYAAHLSWLNASTAEMHGSGLLLLVENTSRSP